MSSASASAYGFFDATSYSASGAKVGNRLQVLARGKEPGKLYVPRYSWLPSQFPTDWMTANLGTTIVSTIPKVDHMEGIILRLAVVVTGGSVVLPATELMFDQVDLYDPNSGASTPVQTQYDLTAFINLCLQADASQQRAIFKTSNIESEGQAKYGQTKPLPAGTHYFYMPLFTFIHNFGPDGVFIQDMKDELKLNLKVSDVIPISGAGSIASCTISFGIEGHLLSPRDREAFRYQYRTMAPQGFFLHPHRSSKQVALVCGSSENYLSMSDVRGPVSHQIVLVRPLGVTNANNGKLFWYNIGDAANASMEMLDIEGNSITGNMPTRFLRQHESTMFPNDFISSKPCYVVSYCHSVNAALKGKIDGGRYFQNQSGDRLRLTLPAAATQEVQTLTQSATPAAGGFYQFRFRGEHSATLAGNASVLDMKAAFEALPGALAHNLTVTFSAVASAGGSFTATFSDPEGVLTGDLLEIVPLDAFAASSSTARTTAGIPGLPADGTYQVDVYSFVYRTADFTNGMAFTSKDWVVPAPEYKQ